ncbi:MAG: hypothetical protein H0X66_07260 [Verrucomicrobia bacterium]|nr:hypothetical protein [Verrucomicrobiota bacterium]
MKRNTAAPRAQLEKGQKWELKDSSIQIGIVGKRLVHYKHFKGQIKRAPLSIASIPVLETYLTENKAVLSKISTLVVKTAPVKVTAAKASRTPAKV